MQLNETISATIEAMKAERAKLDAVINSLEGMTDAVVIMSPRKQANKPARKGWSEAAKKAASKRMKAYWSARAREG
jgi:hypothetical protein